MLLPRQRLETPLATRVQAQTCSPQLFSAGRARALLRCRHITIVGESILRNMAGALAEMLLDRNVTLPYMRKPFHNDMDLHATCGTRLDFMWRPKVRRELSAGCVSRAVAARLL